MSYWPYYDSTIKISNLKLFDLANFTSAVNDFQEMQLPKPQYQIKAYTACYHNVTKIFMAFNRERPNHHLHPFWKLQVKVCLPSNLDSS